MKKGQISIKEIAKLSGVSVATVSRVINNNGRFSEETRKKVLDVIEKYQYNTNAVAKTLRMNKSQTIGIIVPDINNEFFSTIVHGVERYFFERGFSTFICHTDKSPEKERAYIKSLDAKMVDGLVCISGQEEIDDSLLSRNIPIICIDRRPKTRKNISIIESDHFDGGYKATKHLIEKGCRNIIVLTKQSNLSPVNDRIKGYIQALSEYSYTFDPSNIIRIPNHQQFNVDLTKEVIQKEINQGKKIDGIFATNDWLALNAVMALNELGFNVPGNVKVVGFDDDTIAKYFKPSLTTIRQDIKKIVEQASSLLYQMLTNKEFAADKKHIIVPVTLIERDTT